MEQMKKSDVRLLGLVFAFVAIGGSLSFWVYLVLALATGNLNTAGAGQMSTAAGLAVNAGLIVLFGVQHSLMARESVKSAIRRAVPEPLERSVYVHAANAAAWALVLLWQPMPFVIWSLDGAAAAASWLLFGLGWVILLTSAMQFGLLRLHGVSQALAFASGAPQPQPRLVTSGWYRWMRHPMYVGLVLGLWATPKMTAGHLLLAAGFSVYLLIGLYFEERDLARRFGGRPSSA
jgi:protein-S-isoprenylcysteine O-methyltransferase Ste14